MSHSPEAGSAASNQYGTFAVHYASDKQQTFIRNLLDRKQAPADVPAKMAELVAAVRVNKLNKKAASRLIDWLMALPNRVETPAPAARTTVSRPASAKQTALIRKLIGEKVWKDPGMTVETFRKGDNTGLWAALQVEAGFDVEIRDASAAIDHLFACPRIPAGKKVADEPESGMYRDGDRIFRVYLGQQSGRMLVKEVVGSKETGYSYEYIGAAAYRLPATAQPMSLDEAKAWGRMTGTCCVCAARLDNPESVDAGIGPVCAKRFA